MPLICSAITNPDLLRDALSGLTATPKRLPSKYFYDAEGSRLFEEICDLPEYHVTRTELALMRAVKGDLGRRIPPHAVLVEFGSGASIKTRLLLDAAPQIAAYVPIDISESAVKEAAAAIARSYPGLTLHPIVGDYAEDLILPPALSQASQIGYFPGSTIGNFTPREAVDFLRSVRLQLGTGAWFILGADLLRDAVRLVPAYDDTKGVTAAFNKNLLIRLNSECDADFDLDCFSHRAIWNAEAGRMEMHLVSIVDQTVILDGLPISFMEGETIFTESSYKYLLEDLEDMALEAGWVPEQTWTSPDDEFGIFLLKSGS